MQTAAIKARDYAPIEDEQEKRERPPHEHWAPDSGVLEDRSYNRLCPLCGEVFDLPITPKIIKNLN